MYIYTHRYIHNYEFLSPRIYIYIHTPTYWPLSTPLQPYWPLLTSSSRVSHALTRSQTKAHRHDLSQHVNQCLNNGHTIREPLLLRMCAFSAVRAFRFFCMSFALALFLLMDGQWVSHDMFAVSMKNNNEHVNERVSEVWAHGCKGKLLRIMPFKIIQLISPFSCQ